MGALAEDPVSGSAFGPLFSHIMCSQLLRLRSADPYYFERNGVLGKRELSDVQSTLLSDLLALNVEGIGSGHLPQNALVIRSSKELFFFLFWKLV